MFRDDGMTLTTIAGGALEEKFQVELSRVLANIADPNAATGKREITMKVTFSPNGKGSATEIMLAASSKLQPDQPAETMAYLGREGARLRLFEHNPEQLILPPAEGAIAEVTSTKKIGGMK